MNRRGRVILITFLESFATICMERGAYFYSERVLGFSEALNLWVALAFGAGYVGGALLSHRAALRLKERRLMTIVITAQLIVHLVLAGTAGPVLLFVGMVLLGLFNGAKWPVMESYVSAGLTPTQTARAVGLFNISWASSITPALVTAGPLIKLFPPGLFLLPAVINAAVLFLSRPLPISPQHLPHDHPDRPSGRHISRLTALLHASRWSMLGSYSSMWILAALMPHIFTKLGFVVAGPGLSSLLDLVRLGAFVSLWRWSGWCGRVGPLCLSLVALPGGFFLVLFGGNLTAVLVGEILFGLSAGMIYYSGLYYAMVVKGATVDAGGGHESLIGLGFAIGPLAGLMGMRFVSVFGTEVGGMLVGIGPVFLVCAGGTVWWIGKAIAMGRRYLNSGGDEQTA